MVKPDKRIFLTETYTDYNKTVDIPQIYFDLNCRVAIKGGDTFDKVVQIINYMITNYTCGPAVGLDSEGALKAVIKKGGVCSDFSQIFINLCILNTIKVREWGVHDTMVKNKVGHVFNEVFLPETNKWVCVDAFKGLYFVHAESQLPLSVTDIVDAVSAGKKEKVQHVITAPGIEVSHRTEQGIENVFYAENNIFFLVTQYKIKKNDRALKWLKPFPKFIIHFFLIITNGYFRYMIYINDHNHIEINKKLKPVFKHYKPVNLYLPTVVA